MFTTLVIIIEQTLLHLPLMLGAYISISLMKLPDLSIESAYVFGAIIGAQAVCITPQMPLTLALIIALGASIAGGMLVGALSSTLTQRIRIPHLLSSLITIGLFHGINQAVIGSYLSLSDKQNPLALLPIMAHNPELPTITIIVGIVGLLAFMLMKTQLGYACAVYGNNPTFFEQYRISTRMIFYSGVVIANGLAGLSGYLIAQSNGFVEITMGVGKPLLCITALILGKAFLRTKKPVAPLVPIIGCTSYFALQQLLLKVGFNLTYFTAVQAAIVLIILMVHYRGQRSLSVDTLGV